MDWEQFLDIKVNSRPTGQVQTDIKCPACGRYIYLNDTIMLLSYPSKYMYWCSCGWTGYAPKRWMEDGE